MVGIGVSFDEHAGDADRNGSSRQDRDEFALATG
jgi:hypothetical protein